jgi:hypothetical protein
VPDCAALLARARANPRDLRFRELCELAECHGWVRARVRGSHHIYKKRGDQRLMNFQDVDGRAKAYQVRQLIAAIDTPPARE